MNPDTSSTLDHLPHGLKGLIAYPFSLGAWWWLVVAGLMIACILFAWWWKNRSRTVAPEPREDPLLTLEKKLSNMLPPKDFHGKKAIDYFFELNMTFRQYIEARAPIRATDLTLRELRGPLRDRCPLSRDNIEDVLKFLERSEYVKYAGIVTDFQEAVDSHAHVLQWVRFMRPKHSASTREENP
ncbi:MAG: hypothetical protein HYW48_10995 [Deltaproteobacteria bacterium]|nr:hypothetical protein [Deltaproteobacteria bacterium]